jgi:hypothetical protein
MEESVVPVSRQGLEAHVTTAVIYVRQCIYCGQHMFWRFRIAMAEYKVVWLIRNDIMLKKIYFFKNKARQYAYSLFIIIK